MTEKQKEIMLQVPQNGEGLGPREDKKTKKENEILIQAASRGTMKKNKVYKIVGRGPNQKRIMKGGQTEEKSLESVKGRGQ